MLLAFLQCFYKLMTYGVMTALIRLQGFYGTFLVVSL